MRNALIALAVALGIGWLAPSARASEWNKLTKVTFNTPVEIPGQVLPAGTYWFKLLNSESDRNIVQIYNAKRTKQVALLLAVPDYRLKPAGKTVLTFKERAGSAPEALKAWFYPGDEFGQEFVYPKSRASELAKDESQPVLSMPENLSSNTTEQASSSTSQPAVALRQAQVSAQQPGGDETDVDQAVTAPPQLEAQNSEPQNSTRPSAEPNSSEPAQTSPQTLPQTGSDAPFLGLLGLTLASAGLVTHKLVRAASKS